MWRIASVDVFNHELVRMCAACAHCSCQGHHWPSSSVPSPVLLGRQLRIEPQGPVSCGACASVDVLDQEPVRERAAFAHAAADCTINMLVSTSILLQDMQQGYLFEPAANNSPFT